MVNQPPNALMLSRFSIFGSGNFNKVRGDQKTIHEHIFIFHYFFSDKNIRAELTKFFVAGHLNTSLLIPCGQYFIKNVCIFCVQKYIKIKTQITIKQTEVSFQLLPFLFAQFSSVFPKLSMRVCVFRS